MTTPDIRADDWRILRIAGTCLALLVLLVAMTRCAYLGRTADRADVAQAVGALSPACRPLAQMRIRNAILRRGRPVTRTELRSMTSGIEQCDAIDAQMAGIDDGMAQQGR